MFFPGDVTGFLLALGYLKDFGLFIVYQLTQSYFCLYFLPNKYILLDVLLCSIAEYFYELCRILTSP